MAIVRFTSPFQRISGEESVQLEARTLGWLCRELIHRYGSEMKVLLDREGNISHSNVIMVNRRNGHTLSGADTILEEDTEVLIMPFISGG